jgi:toxin ParE1/3/4
MTLFAVSLTDDALADLQDLYDYIAEQDAPVKADGVLDKLDALVQSLAKFPLRGAITKELRDVGIKDYREVYLKPYRVVYRVLGNKVLVYLIVDGRRDMQTLLIQRLIRS